MKLYMLRSDKGWYRRRGSSRWKSCWDEDLVGASIWTTEQGAISAKGGRPARLSKASDMEVVSFEVDLSILMKKMKIIQHFSLDRIKDFEDEQDLISCSEYEFVTVEYDGETLRTYGDYYHDKGCEKAESFIDGWCQGQGIPRPEVIYEERTFNPEDMY